MLAGDHLVALGDAHREPDQVELAGIHGPGVLGHLATDERAPGLPAALGNPLDQLLDVVGVEAAHGDVVEEEERLGTLADDVVDAHGDQVDADGVEPPDRLVAATGAVGAGFCDACLTGAYPVPVPVSLGKGVLETDEPLDGQVLFAGMAVLSEDETALPAADAARRES